MEARSVKTESDHTATLKELSALVAPDPALDTPASDRLDVLVTLV